MKSNIGSQIITKAKEKGAALAGIASVELLKKSPSHEITKLEKALEIIDLPEISLPKDTKSVLVIAVAHPEEKPELDWWDNKSSPGNSILVRIIRQLSSWIQDKFGIETHPMPYAVEKGGIYLKDAAVLGGLGCIGRNNILITPELGPRVRLRAMLLSEYLPSTGPISFDPCDACEEFCRIRCPQYAFTESIFAPDDIEMTLLPGRDGFFDRNKCMIQMDKDIKDSDTSWDEIIQFAIDEEELCQRDNRTRYTKYCRKCELSCPIGK